MSYEVALATYDGKKTWYDYCMVSGFSGEEYFDNNNQNRMAYCMARDLWEKREEINAVESRNELFRFFFSWLGENVDEKGYTVGNK